MRHWLVLWTCTGRSEAWPGAVRVAVRRAAVSLGRGPSDRGPGWSRDATRRVPADAQGLASRAESVSSTDRRGVPLLVSGSVIDEPRVLEILEASGGRVVGDDLCTGWRNFCPPAGRGKDPMDRLMDRHFKRFPCPARMKAQDRATILVDLAQRSGPEAGLLHAKILHTPRSRPACRPGGAPGEGCAGHSRGDGRDGLLRRPAADEAGNLPGNLEELKMEKGKKSHKRLRSAKN